MKDESDDEKENWDWKILTKKKQIKQTNKQRKKERKEKKEGKRVIEIGVV